MINKALNGYSRIAIAIINAPVPEPKPLTTTICNGSLIDNIRVQLFSNPQHMQAASTNNEPNENDKLLMSSKDNIMLAKVMSATTIHIRLPTASLNTKNAIKEVATISKLFSREALAGVVIDSPNINAIGAAMSKTIMLMTYGISRFVTRASFCSAFVLLLNRLTNAIPKPAPKYSKVAINVGGGSSRVF